jgi:methyl-accepting chemotaxis protein
MSKSLNHVIEQDEIEQIVKEMDSEMNNLEAAAQEIEALAKEIDESMGALVGILEENRESLK